MTNWHIYNGDNELKKYEDWESNLPDPPNWRPFGDKLGEGENRRQKRAHNFQARDEEINMVNAALYLRRPLLVTGQPGTGKSSLAYAVANELDLGEVLYWSITTRTTLKDGLYNYDAIGRLQKLQEVKQQLESGSLNEEEKQTRLEELKPKTIENYITLGALGTALIPSKKPRVLLIDEIDKSDLDLPNDLLTILEEGRFEIPELARIKEEVPFAKIRTADTENLTHDVPDGRIICQAFPLIFMTSNGERDFPPPFLRRCLRLTMQPPEKDHLVRIIGAHFNQQNKDDQTKKAQAVEIEIEREDKLKEKDLDELVNDFIEQREEETLANDQLLNALFMVTKTGISTKEKLVKQLLQDLGQVDNDEEEE